MPATSPPRVQYNVRSLLVSGLYVMNLLVLPFEVYLYEVTPTNPPNFRVDSAFAALSTSANQTHIGRHELEAIYNDSSVTALYAHDEINRVDIIRSQLPRDLDQCTNPYELFQHIQGSMYFPIDFQYELVDLTCTPNSTTGVARRWNITLFRSLPMSISVAWLDADSTQFYLYIPSQDKPTLLYVKLVLRVCAGIYMLYLLVTSYYRHVMQLADALQFHNVHDSSTAVRFEVLVGEPTSLIVSDPVVCVFFVLDIWASAEYVGLACLRVSQMTTFYMFILGLLNFGRMMWFSIAGLLLINEWLHRRRRDNLKRKPFQPVDVTYLTMASFTMGPVVVYIQALFPAAVTMYSYLFGAFANADQATGLVTSIDCTLTLAIFSVTMAVLPLILGYSTLCATSATRITVQRVRRVSSALATLGPSKRPAVDAPQRYAESKLQFNHFKQRLSLWLCRDGLDVDGVCYGGSAYRLFNLCSAAQANRTINQRGTDCYVFGYNASNALVEVTRVSLLSQISLPPISRVVPHSHSRIVEHATDQSATCAVGRVVFSGRRDIADTPSIVLRRGAGQSPWIA